MNTQLVIAAAALVAGILVLVAPQTTRFAVGGWLILAGILWLVR